jgi:hypothetical protein
MEVGCNGIGFLCKAIIGEPIIETRQTYYFSVFKTLVVHPLAEIQRSYNVRVVYLFLDLVSQVNKFARSLKSAPTLSHQLGWHCLAGIIIARVPSRVAKGIDSVGELMTCRAGKLSLRREIY